MSSTIAGPVAKPARYRHLATALKSELASRLALGLALAFVLWLGLAPLFAAPAVVPATAPLAEFSAERAMGHLKVLSREPHPMGSPEHEAAVAYLAAELRALGLAPEIQVSSTTGDSPRSAGRITNVLARLPGTGSGSGRQEAVLLVGNYDSMPTTPGAADPVASAAVVLETLRALRAGPALQNDVIVAFIDVDPSGLMGDEAFVAEHPWAKDIGLVLAFANLGIRGPAMLDMVTPAADRFLAEALSAAPYPLGYSALVGPMQAIGGGPLLWAARATGKPGFEFATFNGNWAYHSMLNSVERLDPRLLQHHGSYALVLTRHFSNQSFDAPQGPRLVFFNVAPGVVVSYPADWAVPLAGLVGALGAAVVALGLRRKRLTWRGLGLGTAVFPPAALGTVAIVTLAWLALKALNPNLQVFLIGSAYNAQVYLVGLVALAVAALAGFYALLGRWTRADNLTLGALVWLALLMMLSSLALPGMSYLFTWPLLGVLLGLGGKILAPESARRPWARATTAALGALPAVLLVTPPVFLLFSMLTYMEPFLPVPVGGVPLVFVVLVLGCLLPACAVLSGRRRWLVPCLAALTAVLAFGLGVLTSGFDADHPRPNSIAYVLDTDTQQARWVSADGQLDGWTRQFFPSADGASVARGKFVAFPNANPDAPRDAWQAPAPALALAAPQVVVLEDVVQGDARSTRLRVSSPRGAPNLYLDLHAPGEVTAATLDGKALDLSALPPAERNRFYLAYHALPPEGIEIGLTILAHGPLSLRVEDRSNGLPQVPGLTVSPRPQDVMPAPFELADPTVVSRTFALPVR